MDLKITKQLSEGFSTELKAPLARIALAVLKHAVLVSDRLTESYLRNREKLLASKLREDGLKRDLAIRETVMTIAAERIAKLETGSPEEVLASVAKVLENPIVEHAMRIAGESAPFDERHDLPINDHWWDFFMKFIDDRNESWRQEMLSRALAREAVRPGSIRQSTVWKIVMLDEATFYDLSDFGRYSFRFEHSGRTRYLWPGLYQQLLDSEYAPQQSEADEYGTVADLVERLVGESLVVEGTGSVDVPAGLALELEIGDVMFSATGDPLSDPDGRKAFLASTGAQRNRSTMQDAWVLFGLQLSRSGAELVELMERSVAPDAIDRARSALVFLATDSGLRWTEGRAAKHGGNAERPHP